MDWQRLETVDDLRRLERLSPDLLRTLDRMTPARHRRERPTADISSFVEEVLRFGQRSRSTSSGFLYNEIARVAEDLDHALRPEETPVRNMVLSNGLAAAFADAFDIRERTGGNDDWIGLRHVIMAILINREPAVLEERGMAMEPLGHFDTEPVVTNFALTILASAAEPGENLMVWVDILEERGFETTAAELAAATMSDRELEGPARGTNPTPRRGVSVHTRGAVPPERIGRAGGAINLMAPEAEVAVGPTIFRSGSSDGAQATPPLESDPEPTPSTEPAVAPPNTALVLSHQRNPIAGVRNDDPADLALAEQVGDDGAARALARIIASRAFQPPLAVGIFGAWGSGKSFLMRRVEGEIRRLRGSNDAVFHTEIAEVRFNAWHYIDTDLWANLVGQIFETLERRMTPGGGRGGGLLDKLTTARELTLASARDLASKRLLAQKAEQQLRAAEALRQAERQSFLVKLQAATAAAASGVAELSADTDASKLVETAYGKPLCEMAADWRDPAAALDAMRRDGVVAMEIRRELSTPRPLLVCLAISVGLAFIPLFFSAITGHLTGFANALAGFGPAALLATGLLSTGAAWTAKVTRKAGVARNAVVKAMEAYRKATENLAPDETVQAGKVALDAAELKVTESRIALESAIDSQARAAGEFALSTPLERLKAFLKEKAAHDGAYRSRQGLIGTIRRDFADLAALMADDGGKRKVALAEANAALEIEIARLNADFPDILSESELDAIRGREPAEVDARSFDRIVLYIDDLDRCPADKVVEVLQAVHLLMAFRLFVVIVAVDVRWATGALVQRHAQFGEGKNQAGAVEYLEKIFQLAVWTQPFEGEDAGSFIRGRLLASPLPEVLPTPVPAASSRAGGEDRFDGVVAPLAGGSRPVPEVSFQESTVMFSDGGVSARDEVALEAEDHQALTMTEQEVVWLERVSRPLGLTPRRLLRLLNSYQVARASLSDGAADQFNTGGYRAFAGLLAAVVAWPDWTPRLLDGLTTASDWSAVVAAIAPDEGCAVRDRIEAWCNVLEDEGVVLTEARIYVDLALRFSFVSPWGKPPELARRA